MDLQYTTNPQSYGTCTIYKILNDDTWTKSWVPITNIFLKNHLLHRGVGRNSFILQDIGVGTRNRRIEEYVLFFCFFLCVFF